MRDNDVMLGKPFIDADGMFHQTISCVRSSVQGRMLEFVQTSQGRVNHRAHVPGRPLAGPLGPDALEWLPER